MAPYADDSDDDWTFCERALSEVSRTFAIPIGLLRPSLRIPVTAGYLLCRMVDTVEDDAGIDDAAREALFRAFLGALAGRQPPETFATLFQAHHSHQATPAETELALGAPRVWRVLDGCTPPQRAAITRWVSEMARGMAIYVNRPSGPDGLRALVTLEDLERYCYFVAGTVGHLLTDLFVDALADDLTPRRHRKLRCFAEEFGLGLQLVNILKDVTEDRERGVSFVPRLLAEEREISLPDLLCPTRRVAAHETLRPIFDRAEGALASALEYSLSLPPEAVDVRIFCLLPLMMAVRTLVVARGNDAQLTPGRAVKISRAEVARIVEQCCAIASDDASVRAAFLRYQQSAGPPAPSESPSP